MWTMGILLYVMIFNENPFYGVEETLQCQIKPPFVVSPPCLQLIKKLLAKNPKDRMDLRTLQDNQWVTQKVSVSKYSFRDVVQCSEYLLYNL